MEEIIKSITEAEAQASEIKNAALSRASDIIAEAETQAVRIAEASETGCKLLRDSELRKAEEAAEKEYSDTIAEKRAEAQKYANSVAKNTDKFVNEIVRRVCGGNR